MSILVLKAGLLDTLQDEGRFGYQHLGINPNGSMDLVAASVANMLVGNKRDTPVIELHFPASTIKFLSNCLIALSGADFGATINDKHIPINTAMLVSKESVLKFRHNNKGSRCYFAAKGGWDIVNWLNSYSTNLKASAGGYKGRPLRTGDVIDFRSSPYKIPNTNLVGFAALPVEAHVVPLYTATNTFSCLAGSEYDWLSSGSKSIFQSSSFQISVNSDRMGYQLQGSVLEQLTCGQLLSSAVTRGTVQLLPSGQSIILMADHQTTGGYPKIAHVISAHFPSLAQMRPLEELRFKLINQDDAEAAFVKQQQDLQQLEDKIKLQLNKYFTRALY